MAKRRGRVITLVTLVACLLLASSAIALTTDYAALGPRVSATLVEQTPDPVAPGDVVTVRFKIQNDGSPTEGDVLVEFLPKEPLSSYDGVTKKNIGHMRTERGSSATFVEFDVLVAADAVAGEVEMELFVRSDNTVRAYRDREFLLDVRNQDVIVGIDDIITDAKLAPGQSSNVTIMLKNFADTSVKEVRLSLELNNTPFAPYQSTAEKRVSQLRAGYSTPLLFELLPKPDAAGGVYNVPFTLTYTDNTGAQFTREDSLGLVVGREPTFLSYVKESTVRQANSRGAVTLEIANTGATDMKFLRVTLLNSPHYEILSTTSTRYIGDVDSDDIETEDFDLYLYGDGQVQLPVLFEYADVNNNPYQETRNITLRIFSGGELSKFGITNSPIVPIFIGLVIIGGIAFFFYRRHKKKKKQ